MATLLGILHHKLLRPDNPALGEGGGNKTKPHLRLFVNVKMYHPSRPIVLKAVSVQENLSNNFKHLLKCCPEYGDLSTRAFSIWVGSSPPPKKVLEKQEDDISECEDVASRLKTCNNRGGILVQYYFSSSG